MTTERQASILFLFYSNP